MGRLTDKLLAVCNFSMQLVKMAVKPLVETKFASCIMI